MGGMNQLLSFERVKHTKPFVDGWEVETPSGTLHDSSLFSLIRYCHALGYIEVGEIYFVSNIYGGLSGPRTLTLGQVEDIG